MYYCPQSKGLQRLAHDISLHCADSILQIGQLQLPRSVALLSRADATWSAEMETAQNRQTGVLPSPGHDRHGRGLFVYRRCRLHFV